MDGSEASFRRRKAIEDDLMALMEEIPFDQITVMDIAQRQGIARKTFYRYFPNKQACLEGLLDRTIYECSIRVMQETEENGTERAQYVGWLSFWKDRQDLLNMILRNRLDDLLVKRMAAYTVQEDSYVLRRLASATMDWDEDILLFYLSGQIAVLMKWGAEGFSRPMSEMVDKLHRLIHEPLFSPMK